MNVPKLRFGEFVGNKWQKKQLRSVCNMQAGKFIRAHEIKNNFDEGLYPCYGGNGLRGFTKSFTHEGKHSLIGRQGALCGNVTLAINKFHATEHAVVVSPSEGVSTDWLFYALGKLNLNQYATGQAQPGLSVENLEKVELSISDSEKEQQKIADFLSAVDEKITALTAQKNALTQYKQGMMQRIFSQTLRFKDDNGVDYPDWKNVMFGDIASFSKGKGISKADISDCGKLECIRYGELYTYYKETIKNVVSRTNQLPSALVLSEANDVIIPASGETQLDIATASCVLKAGVALGGDLNIIKSDVDGVFLAYYLNNAKKQSIANLAQGISVVHLYASQLKTMDLDIPEKQEQQKIAQFLTECDNKINAVDAQIQSAQQWKQGLLQQMFV